MVQPYRPELTVLGPQHAGVRMSEKEFIQAQGEEGYRFELIEGVLEAAPASDPYGQDLALAIYRLLWTYDVFAHVTVEPRVFIPDTPQGATIPQPDVAAYAAYPPKPVKSYRGVQPVLVVEVVSPGGVDKDYVRNRHLYAKVPEILEYWIIDPTQDAARPTMTVHLRAAGPQPFERLDIAPGGVYEPARWPGLRVDLGRIAVE